TVWLLAFTTQTNPSPAATATGYGAVAPRRLTMGTRSSTPPPRGSILNSVAAGPLIAQTTSRLARTSSRGACALILVTRLVSGSTRRRLFEPSVTQRAPAPTATLSLLSRWFVTGRGGAVGSAMRRVGTS